MQAEAPHRTTQPARAVSPRRAITRLWALRAQGWPLLALARRLGYDSETPFLLVGDEIPDALDEQITALFLEIGDRKGPCPAAAAEARALGHWPAIYYDDDMHLIRSWIPKRWPGMGPDRYRWSLIVMALTVRGLSTEEIMKRIDLGGTPDGDNKHVQRIRERIGLRLYSTLTILESARVMPGQDAMVREIHRHTAGIAILERVEVLDEPGLDYKALWYSLVDTADLLHGAGEVGTPACTWPEPKARASVAATLTAEAA
jgi:hypothetical protein